jgi:predicted amidohydrolase YtcJ
LASKGSIEVGKIADFVVLDTDLMKCSESAVLQSKIVQTVSGGEVVYSSELTK